MFVVTMDVVARAGYHAHRAQAITGAGDAQAMRVTTGAGANRTRRHDEPRPRPRERGERAGELSTYPPSSTGDDPPRQTRGLAIGSAESRDRSMRARPKLLIDR
jgi:hypothetical protein